LNENQGAESTLSFIQSLLEMRQVGDVTLFQRQDKNRVISAQEAPFETSHSNIR